MKALLLVAGLATVLGFWLIHPLAQDLGYHRFADGRECLGVANFADTLSNVGFLLAGGLGVFCLRRGGRAVFLDARERTLWSVFFWGVLLTGFGSTWYHLAPDNGRLVLDRLPMTVAFMGLLAVVIAERIDVGLATKWLIPLVIVGAGSVVYWIVTENLGVGDLRPYALVQFFPAIVLLPFLILTRRPRYSGGRVWLTPFLGYGAAKLLEAFDAPILHLTGIISGHSLKHLAAALPCAVLAWWLQVRRPVGA